MAKRGGFRKYIRSIFYALLIAIAFIKYDLVFNCGEKFLSSKLVDIYNTAPGKVRLKCLI